MPDLEPDREHRAFLDIVKVLNPFDSEARVDIMRKVLRAFKESNK